MDKSIEFTLSGSKKFSWYIFNNTLFIEKKFTGDLKDRVFEFKREEIDNLIL